MHHKIHIDDMYICMKHTSKDAYAALKYQAFDYHCHYYLRYTACNQTVYISSLLKYPTNICQSRILLRL